MANLLQRICWNSQGWRFPTGELLNKEDSFVGTNGYGLEEWNFATADMFDDSVIGYSYYNPAEENSI